MKLRLVAVRAIFVGLAVLSAAALASCRGPEPVLVAEISGVDWHLESDRNASFRIDDGQLTGTDSCNRIFGEVAITVGERTTIEFASLGATLMACPDDSGAQENMGRALAGERVVEQPDGGTLVLVDESAGGRWRFEK